MRSRRAGVFTLSLTNLMCNDLVQCLRIFIILIKCDQQVKIGPLRKTAANASRTRSARSGREWTNWWRRTARCARASGGSRRRARRWRPLTTFSPSSCRALAPPPPRSRRSFRPTTRSRSHRSSRPSTWLSPARVFRRSPTRPQTQAPTPLRSSRSRPLDAPRRASARAITSSIHHSDSSNKSDSLRSVHLVSHWWVSHSLTTSLIVFVRSLCVFVDVIIICTYSPLKKFLFVLVSYYSGLFSTLSCSLIVELLIRMKIDETNSIVEFRESLSRLLYFHIKSS